MKPTQALLVLCDDEANLRKISAGIRGIVGVNAVQPGCFRKEHLSERQVAMFFPSLERGQPPPGIEISTPSEQ